MEKPKGKKFLQKIWKDEKCLEGANAFLKTEKLDHLQVVEGRRQNGEKAYFLYLKNRPEKQKLIAHPDPMDAAYSALIGEAPEPLRGPGELDGVT